MNLDKPVKIFSTPYELAEKFAGELISKIQSAASENKTFTVALSGGSTPELLFSLLGDHYSNSVPWQYVHFFWGDERCVPPDDPESNFGMTREKLFGKIDIPEVNIHRIAGENDPETEAERYSTEIDKFTESRDLLPKFDIVLLGLGEDGHTASIFPDQMALLNSDKICEVAIHPSTLQKRITITGRVINNADNVTFLVIGEKKAHIVKKIFEKSEVSFNFPASYIVPLHGELNWLIDSKAGSML